jgi:hypothetical protein
MYTLVDNLAKSALYIVKKGISPQDTLKKSVIRPERDLITGLISLS